MRIHRVRGHYPQQEVRVGGKCRLVEDLRLLDEADSELGRFFHLLKCFVKYTLLFHQSEVGLVVDWVLPEVLQGHCSLTALLPQFVPLQEHESVLSHL